MSKKNIYLKIKKESGQSLVQFALILPVLLIVFFTSIEIARIIDTQILLNSAACEIVRSIKKDTNVNDNINKILFENYDDKLNLENIKSRTNLSIENKIYYKYNSKLSTYGEFIENTSYYKYRNITVSLDYKFKLILPISNLLFGDEFVELSSTYTGEIPTGGFEW